VTVAVALPDPVPDRATRPFWLAANEKIFVLPWCTACGRPHWYPRASCPNCYSAALEWRPASGIARLYAWSVVRVNDLPAFKELVPYVAAVVELSEGPRVQTMLVDVDATELRAGDELRVQFVPSISGDWQLPVFGPAWTG
jgi:uncharacterized OB-fold protein